MARC